MNTNTNARRRFTIRRVALSLGTFALVIGITAWAAYLFDAGIRGGGSTTTVDAVWKAGAIGTSASGVSDQVPSSTDGGKSLALPDGLEFYPGDHYEFSAPLGTTGQASYVTGLAMPGLPAGYKAELRSGCGATASGSDSVNVTVRITATPDATGAWSLRPSAGVTLTPTDSGEKPTTCAAYVGGTP